MIRLGSKLRLPSGFPLLAERAVLQTLPGAAIDHFITVIMLLALAPTGTQNKYKRDHQHHLTVGAESGSVKNHRKQCKNHKKICWHYKNILNTRDPRGFAVKFYTEEGNWDIVGNNTPIFFIR